MGRGQSCRHRAECAALHARGRLAGGRRSSPEQSWSQDGARILALCQRGAVGGPGQAGRPTSRSAAGARSPGKASESTPRTLGKGGSQGKQGPSLDLESLLGPGPGWAWVCACKNAGVCTAWPRAGGPPRGQHREGSSHRPGFIPPGGAGGGALAGGSGPPRPSMLPCALLSRVL